MNQTFECVLMLKHLAFPSDYLYEFITFNDILAREARVTFYLQYMVICAIFHIFQFTVYLRDAFFLGSMIVSQTVATIKAILRAFSDNMGIST